MGLTAGSTGAGAVDKGLTIIKQKPEDRVIALAGNPNVGKSTVFNELTGLNQHTGNWPGKTVTNAQGRYAYKGTDYILVDIPGTYSLMAHSAEEVVARDFICFGDADAVVVVCDATCLERNLNLVLQTLEITDRVVVCVNLMDEAKRKGIAIDFERLEKRLGVPVVPASARAGKGLDTLMDRVNEVSARTGRKRALDVHYKPPIEHALIALEPLLAGIVGDRLNPRWLALKLMGGDPTLLTALKEYLELDLMEDKRVRAALEEAWRWLTDRGVSQEQFGDQVVSSLVLMAENTCKGLITYQKSNYNATDRKIDYYLTNKWTGIPIMLLLLLLVFWLTITGANYPSQLLSDGLFWVQDRLSEFFVWMGAPTWLHDMLVLGVYRVLAWVVSVMLPPMAIFFPLFTLLEDLGYLPRVAFNLDKQFKKCSACGKQALTMAMGFGCNAAGVVGCRIIDSPRERLIATLTNNFVPCNGRLPMMISLISMFFIGTAMGFGQSLLSALLLTGVILLGILMTFFASRLLSKTVLKGVPSSFTLELPPFRRPQIGKVIVRSIFDRTLFVLGRAAAVAAPAGLIIWLMANITVGDTSILLHCAQFLDPFARAIGLDGVILMAFVLGFPANEIVIPLVIMAYMATGNMIEMDNLTALKTLLIDNGWTWLTAACTMLFSLLHWPCSTTLLTIHKETRSLKWTALSFLMPTAIGIAVCFIITTLARAFALA
ncbi:ferrous iron transport protein B [Luoshenia tenuis]|jgi:ferrous iron transport protein B|uniref:ferrous iron transport protein B n=1 Tax=Luoshenia tenuis TaxID=2763654 RepID=UPI003D8A9EE8